MNGETYVGNSKPLVKEGGRVRVEDRELVVGRIPPQMLHRRLQVAHASANEGEMTESARG